MSFAFGYPAAFAAAAAVHAGILFAGWGERGTSPAPLAPGDAGAVEVELVASAPPGLETPAALPSDTAPEPPPPEPAPPPPLQPEAPSEPEPSPEIPEASAPVPPEPVVPSAPAAPAAVRAPATKPAPKPAACAPRTGGGATKPGGAAAHGRGGNAPPGYLSNPRPAYPAESRRAGESGTVLLRVEVDAAGRARSVSVARTCGFPRLDRAACEAVKRWRFRPAVRGGAKVAAAVNVPVRFDLR